MASTHSLTQLIPLHFALHCGAILPSCSLPNPNRVPAHPAKGSIDPSDSLVISNALYLSGVFSAPLAWLRPEWLQGSSLRQAWVPGLSLNLKP